MTMSERTCSVEGCTRRYKAKGFCSTHKYRSENGLDLTTPIRQYETGERRCKLLGCDQLRDSDGTYCPMHLARIKKEGAPGEPSRRRMPFGESIWDKPNYKRRHQLMKLYGLTPEAYVELFESQGRCCAICKSPEPNSKHDGSPNRSSWHWDIDHDHVTGKVRGILCTWCNRAIGMFKDDPEIIAAAARYVTRGGSMSSRHVSLLSLVKRTGGPGLR